MIPDPVIGIGLDRIGGFVTESGPGPAPTRTINGNEAKSRRSRVPFETVRGIEGCENFIGFGRKNGFGWSAGRKVDWS